MGNKGKEEAPLTVEYGVKNVISQIYKIDNSKNGKFIDLHGMEIEY